MLSSLGWTLIHATWESGAIAVLLALVLWLGRRASATTRYAISLVALMTAAVLPVMTTLATRAAQHASPPALIAREQPLVAPQVSSRDHSEPAMAFLARPSHVAVDRTVRARIDAALPWLDFAWLAGVLLLSVRMIGGVARVRKLESHTRFAGGRVRDIAQRLADRLGVRSALRVLESTAVDVPMVIGWVRPAVVVPVGLLTGFSPAQLEMVIAHELSHIRRYDTLVNFAQTIVETLLFYHPAIWWISTRVREEREHCCDDLALAATGSDRSAYGSMLLQLEESRVQFALTAAATDGSLLRRVKRIVLETPPGAEIGATWVAGATTMLLALGLVVPNQELVVARSMNAPVVARGSHAAADSARARDASVSSIPAVHPPRRDTMTSRPSRVLAAGAAALALATAPLPAQAPPNVSGRWTLVADTSWRDTNQQSRVIEIIQHDRSVSFVENEGTLTFAVESSDGANIRLKGPTELTLKNGALSFRLDSVADGHHVHAHWSGGSNIELDVKSTEGTLNTAYMTLSLDPSGRLVIRVEDHTQHAGVQQSVQYYRRG